MKFLAFSTDVLPLPGLPTSGTALRTFGLVEGLRAHGHEVLVSVPRAALLGLRARVDVASLPPGTRAALGRFDDLAFDFRNQPSLVQALQPDVVLCGHWPAATFQSRIAQPLVIDLAGPHLLERHSQGTPGHAGAVLGKLRALANADHFIVSGAKQRLYFLSFLLRAGVDRPETRTVTIPMPLHPDVPDRSADLRPADYFPRFVFAGVFLPWQDPRQALEQLAAALAERERGTLKLIGGSFASLSRHSFVQRLPLLPYEQLLDELRGADVALDLMRWSLERELALTIRSTTYLWSGLPVIYNDYADLAELVRRYDAGWTVSPADPAALRRVIDEVFADPAAVARKGRNAARLAREVFSWDRAVEPLLAALGEGARDPRREVDIDVAHAQEDSLAVLAGRPIEQRFLSRIDGLSRVECCLATHGRDRLESVTLSLHRVARPSGPPQAAPELLATRTVPGNAIRNNEWLTLEVAPITDSAGCTFALSIESAARGKEESVSPWALRFRPFPLLDLRRGGRRLRGASLCLRASASPPGR